MPDVTVGMVVHEESQDAVDVASSVARHLAAAGVDVQIPSLAATHDRRDDPAPDNMLAEAARVAVNFPQGCDLVMTFGGDGTFLRAAHECRDAGVPLLGVNLGRLGFLAEVEADGVEEALRCVINRAWTIESRKTLDVVVEDAQGAVVHHDWALNEVSIEKTARQRMVRMDLHLGNEYFGTVPADALVVATSTGSTAYALSAGGPIVSPKVEATLVVPVAPHSLFDRTVVAGPDEAVAVTLQADQPAAVVSCDGRTPATLPAGGRAVVSGSSTPVRVARVHPTAFYALVRRKFRLQ